MRLEKSILYHHSVKARLHMTMSLFQTENSLPLNVISNAPVDISWPSTALLMKKIIMQAYI